MANPAMRVLVTGASGFLGGYTVRELAAHGMDVWGGGRDVTALSRVVPPERRIVGDLSDLADTALAVDAVIHCAALSSPWARRSEFDRVNVEGTAYVVEFCRRNGVRRLVHVSSPSIYAARGHRTGIREEDVDPKNALNGYIRSKIAAEALLRRAHTEKAIDELVIIRPRGLIGPGDPSLIPRLMDVARRVGVPLFGGGEHVIDVTAVENVALALRLALTSGDGGVFNITNGEPRTFRSLLEQLGALTGEPMRTRRLNRGVAWCIAAVLEGVCAVLPGRPEPPLTRYTLTTIAYAQTLDISRARAELGYAPAVSLDDALARVAHARKAAA